MRRLSNGMVILPVSAEGKSHTLNFMEMRSEIERLTLFARMVEVELTPERKETVLAVMQILTAGATIADFVRACRVVTAAKLGITLGQLEALSPLLRALETMTSMEAMS